MGESKENKVKRKIGVLPGTLVYTGDVHVEKPRLKLQVYNSDGFEFNEFEELGPALQKMDSNKVNWLAIEGLNDVELVRKIGEHFNIHSLVLEDIVNTQQIPKVEVFDDYVFITLKDLLWNRESETVESRHFSFILGNHFLISFQERPDDIFKNIQDRIASPTTKVKQRKADYLLYYLIDLLVDRYYYVFEDLNRRTEQLEIEVMEESSNRMTEIITLKKDYNDMRKQMEPLNEAIRELNKSETILIEDYVTHYFNDVMDHVRHYLETVRSKQESLASFIDLYMSIVSTKMNRVMYILTIVMTIFVPLTFIAGIYGMNFTNMPELEYRYSYFIVLGVMLLIGIGTLVIMKKKRWF